MPDNEDLDLTLLNEIADGSDEFIIESIDMFLQQTPEILKIIDDSMDELDWITAAASAHKIKATLGFFGMLTTQALVQEVELACKAGAENPYQIIEKYNQVKSNLAINTLALIKLKAALEAGL